MIYGYARVSTLGQTLEVQLEQLQAAGCEKIFKEKATGKNDARGELQRMLKALQAGDVLIVTRLDRLARSQRDLLNMLHTITAKGAGFRSLRDTWADTTTMHGRLIIHIVGGIAEFERELIIERTSEGRSRATARGQHMGRPPALTPQQQTEARQRRKNGATVRELAASYNVGRTTIQRVTGEAAP